MALAHPGSRVDDGLAGRLDARPQFVGALPGAEQLAFRALPDAFQLAEFRRLPGDPGLPRLLVQVATSVSCQGF